MPPFISLWSTTYPTSTIQVTCHTRMPHAHCPTMQVLRRLILFGFPSDAKSLTPVEAVNACMPPMVQALTQMMALATGGSSGAHAGDAAAGGAAAAAMPKRPPRSHLLAMLQRGVLKLLKTQCQVQEVHPW